MNTSTVPSAGRAPRRLSEEELRAIYSRSYVEIYDPHARHRIGRMLPLFDLSSNEVVADFACGNGVLLELIEPLVARYVGIDFSEPFVAEAERRRAERGVRIGAFECADIAAFCRAHPGEFDVGFALDFSEHIYDDQFVTIFAAIHDALKPGGRLYLHTPNGDYVTEHLRHRGVLSQSEGHVAVRDAAANAALLTGCGFTDVRVRYLPHYLRLASALHLLGALPIVGRFFRARLFLSCRKPPVARRPDGPKP